MAVSPIAGAVDGVPRILLRLEGLALAAAAVYTYHRVGGSWWLFACLILVPDVSLLGYLGGTRFGVRGEVLDFQVDQPVHAELRRDLRDGVGVVTGVVVQEADHRVGSGGTRLGAIAYNAFHVTLGPLACGALGFLLPSFDLIQVALVWAAHVGIDRAFGLGLKYNAGFGFTHLGRIGGAMSGS